MSTETTLVIVPDLSQELYGLNLHVVEINSDSSDGAKHCIKVTE